MFPSNTTEAWRFLLAFYRELPPVPSKVIVMVPISTVILSKILPRNKLYNNE